MDEIKEESKAEIKAEIVENNEKKIVKEDIKEDDTQTTPKIENEAMKKEAENSTYKEEKKYNTYEITNKKNKKHHGLIITIIIAASLLLIIGCFSTVFALINSNNNTILSGIYIREIPVQGMTESEAIEFIKGKLEHEKTKEIPLIINGETFSITAEQIETEYGVEEAVKKAYSIGRTGNIFQNNYKILGTMINENNFDIEITFNEELLKNVLEDYGAKVPNVMVDNSYYIEDNELVIVRGIDGVKVNLDKTKEDIINAIKQGKTEPIKVETIFVECPEINIEKIYEEVKCEPQDATYKTNPFEIIPHKVGLDFDVDEAKKLLEEEKEEYTIKLTVIEPKVHTNEIGEEAFPDLLSKFETKYDETNTSRSGNLKIAMSKLNGVVIMPGEVFSYNKTLGKRTADEGYKNANGFAGGRVVPMLAGGICQISSTLYDAALYAGLNIVERHNHMFQATYVEPGKDATVVYGSLDFKFENTRNYPIMIKTKCGGGLAEIKIFGIKEEVEYDYEIITQVHNYVPYRVVYEDDYSLAPGVEKVSQYGLQGCKSTTYRIKKLNGQEISKEVLSTDTYDPLNKIVRRGVGASNPEPVVEPEVEQHVETPTQVLSEPVIETQEQPAQEIVTPVIEETPSETPETPGETQEVPTE